MTFSAGAPECYRPHYLRRTHQDVGQAVDVWSLGCVFSEVSCWTNLGWSGLSTYRNNRRKAEKRPDLDQHDCFHDGDKRLKLVDQLHDSLCKEEYPFFSLNCRIIPYITDMLTSQLSERPSAQDVMLQFNLLSKVMVDEGWHIKEDALDMQDVHSSTPPLKGMRGLATKRSISASTAHGGRKKRKLKVANNTTSSSTMTPKGTSKKPTKQLASDPVIYREYISAYRLTASVVLAFLQRKFSSYDFKQDDFKLEVCIHSWVSSDHTAALLISIKARKRRIFLSSTTTTLAGKLTSILAMVFVDVLQDEHDELLRLRCHPDWAQHR